MPIYLSGDEDSGLLEDYQSLKNNLKVKQRIEEFFDRSDELVESLDLKRCLYVGQREYATVRSDDKFIDFIGSTDATTCHIVLLVDKQTNNCSLCHFDGSDTVDGIASMINSLKCLRTNQDNMELFLYIVGGFSDSRRLSVKLTNELLNCLNWRPEKLILKLCCVTELNNTKRNNIDFPIIYGIAYNIKTKTIFKCNQFAYKGPDLEVRSARHFSNCGNICIYNPIDSILMIGPFDYDYIDCQRLLQRSDIFLLKACSTSPEQEPEDFACNLRNAFKITLQHPEPLVTYFLKGKGKFYKRVDNVLEWVQIEDQ